MDPVSRAQCQLVPENRQLSGKARTQFKPGQSGNPGGRPKKLRVTKIMEQIARSKDGKELLHQAITDIIAKRGMAAVLMIREMAERLEGKVTQPVEMSGELILSLAESVKSARERKLLPNANNSNAA